jgi:ATP-dependent DNA helicase DinG
MLRARDVLGPGAPLARTLEGWEHRPGQLAMAEAVERALTEEKHLFVEAGTGTGKTLAYLVPAVLSGRKVVISTATKALQEQIFVKDLPLVTEALTAHGVEVSAALMKGLGNYVCLRRLEETKLARGGGADRELSRILEWARETDSGDRAELADLREDSETWREVASSSETRVGFGCPYYERCFITRMRREAEEASIVVVNHHLFLADLALRTGPREGRAAVLPAYDAVIFDEAHQIEDIATDFFGVRVSSARVEALLRDAERALAAANALEALRSGPVRGTLESAREAGHAFFLMLAGGQHTDGTRRVLSEHDLDGAVLEAYQALDLRLQALYAVAFSRGEEPVQLIAHRTADLRDDLRGILRPHSVDGGDDPHEGDLVRWIDVRARSVSLGASPVDIGESLHDRLFERIPTVICTSATLAVPSLREAADEESLGGSAPAIHEVAAFGFAKARMGAPPETEGLLVASPFDFASRAALYLPSDLPDPADPAFEGAATDRIVELVTLTGGGAFVLCTSTRAMKGFHAALRGRVRGPLLVQGERPKHMLLSRFRASGKAVLVATMSFWEGVDVPGWALRLVVLDKIPFAPPNDPVVQARCARIDREGGSGFAQYSVPSAAMTLKQGFGRLIRTQKDAGIVALLDRRITKRGYGRMLLAALPPARRAKNMEELRAFWGSIAPEVVLNAAPP